MTQIKNPLEENEKELHDLVYDVTKESPIISYLGSFRFPQSKSFLTTYLVLFYVDMLLFRVYLVLMAFKAIANMGSLDNPNTAQIFQGTILLIGDVFVPCAIYASNQSLNNTMSILRSGTYKYSTHNYDDTRTKIQKKYIKDLRFFNTIFKKFTTVSTFVTIKISGGNTFVLKNYPEHPFFPIPIKISLNLNNPVEYIITFIVLSVIYLRCYCEAYCVYDVYIGCAQQPCAQLDILNYSISAIEERARLTLVKMGAISFETMLGEVEETEAFQECLLLSLKENLQHHQVILRLKNEISTYIGLIYSILLLFFPLSMATHVLILIKSEDMRNSLYSTPWAKYGQRYKVMLHVMLENLHRPILMTSRGIIVDISSAKYADMMSTMYKFVNVIR